LSPCHSWQTHVPAHACSLFDSRRVVIWFFWPSCWVSTQWLSSSKWLPRGGRRFRCVHFCALHSQCLPKTVGPTPGRPQSDEILNHPEYNLHSTTQMQTQMLDVDPRHAKWADCVFFFFSFLGWWKPNPSLKIQETVPDRCPPTQYSGRPCSG